MRSRTGQVGTGQDGTGQVGTGQLRTGQVWNGSIRRVGSFSLSGGTPDNAAAIVGKLVLLGNSNSTKSVHK